MLLSITFFVVLALSAVGVALTMRSGRRGDRSTHLRRAVATVALLVCTVVLAIMLGETRKFPEGMMGVHKIIARAAGLLVLAVVFTGIMLWRRPAWRRLHQGCVYGMVVVLAAAIATGTWAFILSAPRE